MTPDPIDRLLEAARSARPPIPEPSPWLEQRVLAALRTDTVPFFGLIDGGLIFRMLIGAAGVVAVSLLLPLFQTKDPYTETMYVAQATAQLETYR